MLAAMGANNSPDQDELRVFHTGDHACGYWPARIARDLVLDPRDPRMPNLYPLALGWGFRRSGDIVYRPHCQGCRACVAVRIPVNDFVPNRSQRRCLARNAQVEARIVPAERTDEQLALYQRYLRARHRGGGMDEHGGVEFDQFLIGSWSHGRFMELRERGDHGPGKLRRCDHRCRRQGVVRRVHLLRPRPARTQPRHVGAVAPDRMGASRRTRAPVPRLLDRWPRQDGLQAALPSARSVRRPDLAALAHRGDGLI
jgi:hypothetical protein